MNWEVVDEYYLSELFAGPDYLIKKKTESFKEFINTGINTIKNNKQALEESLKKLKDSDLKNIESYIQDYFDEKAISNQLLYETFLNSGIFYLILLFLKHKLEKSYYLLASYLKGVKNLIFIIILLINH